ncbi:hypothetical protein MPSEU_001009900 [Mayamaea pseudoterrestris]|nr:hypothetical protein MPSEU_001009900 [Mayamaea pseudoterrestris]
MDESFFASLYSEQMTNTTTSSALSSSIKMAASPSSPSKSVTSEIAPPDDFICPISLQPMVHPLTTRSGLNFERSAILNWLQQGTGACPLTRQPLRPSDLIPNKQLETRIRFWRMQNNIPEPSADDDDFDAVAFLGFLPVGESKTMEVVSRHEAAPMSLRDVARAELRANQRTAIHMAATRTRAVAAAAAAVPAVEVASTMTRRPKEGRRNFLSRILKQTTEDLETL